jgi:hypothetical protein
MTTDDKPHGSDSRHPGFEVIFSLADGFAWMSWPGSDAKVRVGAYEAVAAAMQDFLLQGEVGERLTRRRPPG